MRALPNVDAPTKDEQKLWCSFMTKQRSYQMRRSAYSMGRKGAENDEAKE